MIGFIDGFIDGVFDGLHYGHIHVLFQAKEKCKNLHAATHTNDEIFKYKNKNPIFNYNERFVLLNNCKFIDVLHNETIYNTNINVLNDLGCDIFFHGDDNINVSPLLELKNLNKLSVYNRTSGISTTNLIERIRNYKENRIVKTNNDFIYLKYLFDKINLQVKSIENNKNVVILTCNWDFFNISHINLINDIKTKYDTYSIYVDLVSDNSEYIIYNKREIAITLLGIKNIDKVILYENENNLNENNVILINSKLSGALNVTKDDSFNSIINGLKEKKVNIIDKIDINNYKVNKTIDKSYLLPLYKNILKTQFADILSYIKNINFNENDIIIFDIDEVCLCNLMYHNLDYKEFNFDNNEYNCENGLIPLNTQCKKLFNYIHKNKIKYSFITGRRDYIRDITIDNLELVKLNKYNEIYTCPNDYIGDIQDFKEKCRKNISKKQNIVCCVGDQLSDISGQCTGIPFLIFNPFYQTK